MLPTDLSQLNKYYDQHAGRPPSFDAAILERYQLVQVGNLRDIANFSAPIILEKTIPADADYDSMFKISVYGYSYEGIGKWKANRSGSGPFNSANKINKFKTDK